MQSNSQEGVLKSKDVVCIDAHILIWGVRRYAEPGQEMFIPRAEYFLNKCQKEGINIVVPSIVLAELLAGVSFDVARELARTMQKRFMIVPFDARAAEEFGQMWRRWKENNPNGSMNSEGFTRQQLKADYMILATAIVRGAWCIYSHDNAMKRFADGYIEVVELPEMPPRQGNLPY